MQDLRVWVQSLWAPTSSDQLFLWFAQSWSWLPSTHIVHLAPYVKISLSFLPQLSHLIFPSPICSLQLPFPVYPRDLNYLPFLGPSMYVSLRVPPFSLVGSSIFNFYKLLIIWQFQTYVQCALVVFILPLLSLHLHLLLTQVKTLLNKFTYYFHDFGFHMCMTHWI